MNVRRALRRFERTGALDDLERVVLLFDQAVAATPSDHPDRAPNLANLGHALGTRFHLTGVMDDLDRAALLFDQAVAASPANHPDRVTYLSNLGSVLETRFELTGVMDDLDRAIEIGGEVVATTPTHHPDRPMLLSNFGADLRSRFERMGAVEDIDRAVEIGHQAVAATPADHPDRALYLANLGRALARRSERTGIVQDLDRAVLLFDQAIAASPADDPDRAMYLSELGEVWQMQFERTGAVEDLHRAVEIGDQVVAATPADHPGRPMLLSNVGRGLARRFERTGSVEDVDRAIVLFDQAVAASPADDPSRARYLTSLGTALGNRFEQTGAMEDLDRAVEISDQAVTATPADHPDRPMLLSNVGGALLRRFERTGSVEDLDRAIVLFDQAVAASPVDHPNRVLYLSNLGVALENRFERTGAVEDVDRAVEISDQAVRATPADHPDRPMLLSNVGGALLSRFERTGAVDDLDRAVEISAQAVAAAPADHPDRAKSLFNLGSVLATRFYERAGRREDLDRALTALREAAGLVSAPALVRAQAAEAWGEVSEELGDWAGAVDGFGMAAGLLELIAPRGLGRADQEYRLGKLLGVGPAGAAACLQAGLAGRAVELFEQGRGVLFTQVLDARSDLVDLAEAHPGLAEEFARWRDELDSPDQPRNRREAAAHRREAAAHFDRVLVEIRALTGFERFLLPVPLADLLPAAAEGPVVLINVTGVRSDALVLTPDGVEVLGLPEVDPEGVGEQVNRFLAAVHDAQNPGVELEVRVTAEQRLTQILGWVWDHVTGPVLEHLRFSSTPVADAMWPRLWWCPSGPLALLPLHAAGHHETRFDARPATVIDRVVSSTIPTARALLHARPSTLKAGAPRVLVVAMPHTPDETDLPGSRAEADFLARLFPGQVDVVGSRGTKAATFATVTAALAEHAWAHFACHGTSDLDDPSASSLLLEDYQSHPLSVLDLTRQRLDHAEFAFLAACTTARVGAALPDEPIHLAGACQLAGYRHVIATQWPIGDDDAVRLTKAVYTALAAAPRAFDADTAARALHGATRQLRYLYPNWPSHWAAYTHAGP